MRLVIISDTHTRHNDLDRLSGDLLIHCGDFCEGTTADENQLFDMDRWFGRQDFDRILCIGGNHDFAAQQRRDQGTNIFENATYLEDETYFYSGINFYGSPWLPDLAGWAYYLPDHQRRSKWDLIPLNTNVLITHTPPFGILDKTRDGSSVGCSFLRAALEHLNLDVHCFGHVHASYGDLKVGNTRYCNASVIDSAYCLTNMPIVIDL